MKLIKKYFKDYLNKRGYIAFKKENFFYTGASDILELKYGHYSSKKEKASIDSQNNYLPWFTYSSIEYLNQLDLSKLTMLEWGAGNSSIFFSNRVKEIYSIEHDKEWYNNVKDKAIKNQTLFLENKSYASLPLDLNRQFDIILIDGIKRDECTMSSLKILKTGGIIILDNSDRYPNLAKILRDNDLLEVDFHGFGPINDYTWTTSIFFDRTFNVSPIKRQPVIPIGGGF